MSLRYYQQGLDRFQVLLQTPIAEIDVEKDLSGEWGFCQEFKFKDTELNFYCSLCPLYTQYCSIDLDEAEVADNTLHKIIKAVGTEKEPGDQKEFERQVTIMIEKITRSKHLFELENLPQYDFEEDL